MPTVHLVRHGEVANPNHVVYSDLPGFNLSATGVLQAHAAAGRLATEPIDRVVSSPLARAMQTATAIARRHGLEASAMGDLIESHQYPEWTGEQWDEIPIRFPIEFATYLEDATKMQGVHESIDDIAGRVIGVIDACLDSGYRNVVVVGHQDPTQAARLALTARSLARLRLDPPAHASVVTLNREDGWIEASYWAP